MHFSGFAAGLKAAFAAMALLAASPAVAQGDSALGRWMVTASPGTYNNGTSYCTLQNSNTRPIIEFTIMGYRDGRVSFRSEERRVGKECRAGRRRAHEKQK